VSDTTLRDLVLARLEKDTGTEDEWAALVLAALESTEELDQLLADGNDAARKGPTEKQEATPKDAPKPPRTAFLLRLTAQAYTFEWQTLFREIERVFAPGSETG
jgi:hypothetical protein